ncbi:unnamed protein product, partial [Ectocarpus sp. 6 AP-2014]
AFACRGGGGISDSPVRQGSRLEAQRLRATAQELLVRPGHRQQQCERGRASCTYLLDLPNDFGVALRERSCVVQRATARDSARTEREREREESGGDETTSVQATTREGVPR